ncbi:MAG: 30S ribosomal protein S17 [Myxococcota bacterium]
MSERGFGRVLQGVVTSDKMAKTITIAVTRTVPHKDYNKFIKRQAKYHAHDEREEAHVGDTVEIVEARPLSKTKRFRLQRVLEKARI